MIVHVATSLLPVFAFLAALILVDSFKLVRLQSVLLSISMGILAAAVCYLANRALIDAFGLGPGLFSRYGAPLTEEITKAVLVVALIATHRVGFLVDAAIFGFAVGAGFAFLENIYYLQSLPDAGVGVWIVRGFGTAMMHGGATTIVAVVGKALYDRGRQPYTFWIPGLTIAILLHSAFNHFILPPWLATAAILLVLPGVVSVVFQQSEAATREWLGVGFDTDQALLDLISSGRIDESPVGQFLLALRTRFPGEVIADMLCLIRLHVELSIRAKGILLMKEAGFQVRPDPEIRQKFEELDYLEQSIGRTGLLAMGPIRHTSSRDLWQLNMLARQ